MTKMRKFRLEKLVHDEIVQRNLDIGIEVDYEVLGGEDWAKALEEKLKEEQKELEKAETDEGKAKEQGDINDVLFALGRLSTPNFIPTKTFNLRHFVHTVTVPADNEWAEYYAHDPETFPEETAEK